MKKIVAKLMDYGMDFDYEHNGSSGEIVMVHILDLRIHTREGNICMDHEGETECITETERGLAYVETRVEEICIAETT